MRVRPAAGRKAALTVGGLAAVLLAGLATAGCAAGPAAPGRASVQSCIRFGIGAIEHHVTVRSVPAACRGLTRVEINFAVGSALHAMADGADTKAGRRELAASLSPLLEHLVTAFAPSASAPSASAPSASAPSASAPALPGPALPGPGRPSYALLALCTWLVTIGLGAWMLVRWIARGRAGPAALPAPVLLGHFGLAVTGLLTWIAYLSTGLAGLAWAGCLLLLPVTGLGMGLLGFGLSERSVTTAPSAGPAGSAVVASPDPATGDLAADSRPAGHPAALFVAAHGAFAVATILFAFLAAAGLR